MLTKQSKNYEVLVVGAGVGGLVLTVLLLRAGVRVRLIDPEPAADPRPRPSLLHSRSLELLELGGLLPSAVIAAHGIEGIEFWRNGHPISRLDFRGQSTPYPFAKAINRAILEDYILNEIQRLGGRVERGSKLLALWLERDSVRCKVDDANGVIQQLNYPYVVGCDGGGKVLRECLQVSFQPLEEEVVYGFVEASVKGRVSRRRATVFLHPEGSVEFLPLENANENEECRFRLMATLPISDMKGEFTVEQMQILIQERVGEGIFLSAPSWAGKTRVRPAIASRMRAGRVFFLGADAHRHDPMAGQSLDSTIGDAFNLFWKLRYVLNGDAPPTLVEETYERERGLAARRAISSAKRLLDFGNLKKQQETLCDRLLRNVSGLLPIEFSLARDLCQLSQHYRGGPLTTELRRNFRTRSQIRAGERVPDAVVPSAVGNPIRLFDRLKGNEFTLVVRPGSLEAFGSGSLGEAKPFTERAKEMFRGHLRVIWVMPPALGLKVDKEVENLVVDVGENVSHGLGIVPHGAILIRPDFYCAWASERFDAAQMQLAISSFWT